MRILITGASGLFGSKLAQIATQNQHQVYAVFNQHFPPFGIPIIFDVTDKEQVDKTVMQVNPEVIVHAAALSDVDKCEQNPELAYKTNVYATQKIAKAAQANNAFLIYISTDYVFDGENGNYTETDQPSPINYYGYTKLQAEEQIKKNTKNYCIARTSVIYGATPAVGKINFALWILNKLKNKESIKVFIDQYNSPTLNTNLSDMILEIAERKLTGTYHLSGATRISRHQFAILLAKAFNQDPNQLTPINSKELVFPAKRPKDSSLNTKKAQQTLKSKPLQIDQAIEELKTELNSTPTN
jgi:dTDP-4-dehydrorhamnose reductase